MAAGVVADVSEEGFMFELESGTVFIVDSEREVGPVPESAVSGGAGVGAGDSVVGCLDGEVGNEEEVVVVFSLSSSAVVLGSSGWFFAGRDGMSWVSSIGRLRPPVLGEVGYECG